MIYSEPFPKLGTNYCPTKSEAERIILIASAIDGDASLGDAVKNMMDDAERGMRLKSNVSLDKARKEIAKLWERMSKKAKVFYFVQQQKDAIAYLESCMANIRAEFPDAEFPTPLPIPKASDFLARWVAEINDSFAKEEE